MVGFRIGEKEGEVVHARVQARQDRGNECVASDVILLLDARWALAGKTRLASASTSASLPVVQSYFKQHSRTECEYVNFMRVGIITLTM